MPDFVIKQNDRTPSITVLLKYSDNTIPNLAGATVRFLWKKAGAALRSGNGVILEVPTAKVRYDWAVGDTDTAGIYDAEFEVTFADGRRGTFPTVGYISLEITDDLD